MKFEKNVYSQKEIVKNPRSFRVPPDFSPGKTGCIQTQDTFNTGMFEKITENSYVGNKSKSELLKTLDHQTTFLPVNSPVIPGKKIMLVDMFVKISGTGGWK